MCSLIKRCAYEPIGLWQVYYSLCFTVYRFTNFAYTVICLKQKLKKYHNNNHNDILNFMYIRILVTIALLVK